MLDTKAHKSQPLFKLSSIKNGYDDKITIE